MMARLCMTLQTRIVSTMSSSGWMRLTDTPMRVWISYWWVTRVISQPRRLWITMLPRYGLRMLSCLWLTSFRANGCHIYMSPICISHVSRNCLTSYIQSCYTAYFHFLSTIKTTSSSNSLLYQTWYDIGISCRPLLMRLACHSWRQAPRMLQMLSKLSWRWQPRLRTGLHSCYLPILETYTTCSNAYKTSNNTFWNLRCSYTWCPVYARQKLVPKTKIHFASLLICNM